MIQVSSYQSSVGRSGECSDGLSSPSDSSLMSPPACAPGTDCDDCGHRPICTSCPAECAARTANGHDDFCLEEMYTDTTRCYEACNNRECLHNSGGCNTDAKFAACYAAQEDVASTLTTVPTSFDASTQTSVVSSVDGAAAPVRMSLAMSGLRLQLNSASYAMEATFDLYAPHRARESVCQPPFPSKPNLSRASVRVSREDSDIAMQWQDSRLATSPCAYVYTDVLTTSGASPAPLLTRADNLLERIWHPSLTLLASDRRTAAIVVYDRTRFAVEANTSWLVGEQTVPCEHCATYRQHASATVPMEPRWRFFYFPFDRHNISFILSAPSTNLSSSCRLVDGTPVLFESMGLTAGSADSKLLPATAEWQWLSSYASGIDLSHPLGDTSKCEVKFIVRRQPLVFIVKQLAISVLVVFSGLCALFLHVGDHTGDRTALILVSALIVSGSFQAELNLGPIQYLVWFDCSRVWTRSQHAHAHAHVLSSTPAYVSRVAQGGTSGS